jgi:predicted DNA-binding antitoxin AbrB/MazE fold protein
MTRQLEVVYDAGVLRPLEPLPFADQQKLLATLTDNLDAGHSYNTREREQEWLRLHGPEYPGKWLALEGGHLVSQGENAREVLERARALGVAHPLLVQIPVEPELPFGGW